MLFLCYWELNENMSAVERLTIGQKLMSSGASPGKKVKMLRWDATPDLWGIALFEADSAADAQQFLDVWRIAGTGFFKSTRMAPAMPVQEWMERSAELMETLPR
jgi:Domain of unknown function (DUF3303)